VDFYVYVHKKKTDGSVFYVGKGKGKRAWKKSCRNEWWKRIEEKHGRTVEIIARGLSEDEAFALEAKAIAAYGRDNLCNLTDGGEGGKSPSEDTRKKMSAAHKGKIVSEITKERHRVASTGRRHSEETKEKLRRINLGKVYGPKSEEVRRKISEAKKGQKFTDAHCAAISAAKVGKKKGPMPDYVKEALRLANTGRALSKETREKISKSNQGKRHTPETIKRMTEHNKRNNAARRKPILCSNGLLFEYSDDAEKWLRDNGKPAASRANIVSCCTGKLKTAYGFTWRYASKADLP